MPLIQTAVLAATGLLTSTALFGVPVTADDGSVHIECGAVWSRLPQDLRADLLEVRDLPVGERSPVLREIRDDALAGDYGDRVQQFVANRDERARWVRRHLPADLRSDVDAARELSGQERIDAYLVVRGDALAGEYGDRVQHVAERVQERRESCRES